MKTISLKQLKKKIDRKDKFKLVFTLGEWHFHAKHIPGSIHADTEERVKKHLRKDDDIVIYCSNPTCAASMYAYRVLKERGFKRVRRFAGGVVEWEQAGYPLSGHDVEKE